MSSVVRLATVGIHEVRPGAVPHTRLQIVELACDVARRSTRERRHRTEPSQLRAMTDGAGRHPAIVAGGREALSSCDGAGGYVGDEAGGIIPQLGSMQILRRLDHARADRLHPAAFDHLVDPAGEPRLGHHVGLYHANPRLEVDRREILGRHPSLGIGGGKADPLHEGRRAHPRLARLASTVSPIRHLLHDVLVWLPRHTGVLRLALSVRQVAVAARDHPVAAALGDELRHRRVRVRVPVGRAIVEVDRGTRHRHGGAGDRHHLVGIRCIGVP